MLERVQGLKLLTPSGCPAAPRDDELPQCNQVQAPRNPETEDRMTRIAKFLSSAGPCRWWARLGSNQEPAPYEGAARSSPACPKVPCRAPESSSHLSFSFSAVPYCPTLWKGVPPHVCSNSAPTGGGHSCPETPRSKVSCGVLQVSAPSPGRSACGPARRHGHRIWPPGTRMGLAAGHDRRRIAARGGGRQVGPGSFSYRALRVVGAAGA